MANVLMTQLAPLEIENDEALEQVIIKYQVDIEIAAIGTDALLAGDKGEALAQFQQEGLKLAH